MSSQSFDALSFEAYLACHDGPPARPTRESIDEGRFARAISAHKSDHFSTENTDADMGQRNIAFVSHRQVFALKHSGHSSRPR